MRVREIRRDLWLLARHPSVFLGRRGYVLILSHMRSYSTLLAHLLGSHPEISGYAEAHVSLTRPRDLLRLRGEVASTLDGHLRGRLVLDKLLHNHLAVGPEILNSSAVYPVFLVRRPAETLRSILRMNERLPDKTPYRSMEDVTAYYVSRLAALERIGRAREEAAFVVRGEQLVNEPEPTLAALTRFLDLETPIATTYSTFPLTGVAGKGDYSDTIRLGRIVARSGETAAPDLDPKLLALAEDAYASCLESLESR